MRVMLYLITFCLSTLSFTALATGNLDGEVTKQPINITAISMFLLFVAATLGITYWAARRTRTTRDFYAAGGSITGLQNGLAIAGDYMSAASFLGISGLVFASGFDGLIYSIGFLVGWPIILFLLAERLRNLGKYTFADAVSFRLRPVPIRSLSACGTLVVVLLYLIAQMVGAGKLIQVLFGLEYQIAVVLVRILMILYVTFGGMIATIWVYILGNAEPIFPYKHPALFSMTAAFIGIFVVSLLDNSKSAKDEANAFTDQYVRSQTGLGSEGATAH